MQEEASHSPPTSPPLCICPSQFDFLSLFFSTSLYPFIDSVKGVTAGATTTVDLIKLMRTAGTVPGGSGQRDVFCYRDSHSLSGLSLSLFARLPSAERVLGEMGSEGFCAGVV